MEQAETGLIFGVQHFSVDDGPGIRTTVFIKGCNARCQWCHNPESIPSGQTIRYFSERCILCGMCAESCPLGLHSVIDGKHLFNRGACTGCGRCADACCQNALERTSWEASVTQILEAVIRDARYYMQTGGGMTLSGGEPMMQPRFAEALLRGAKMADINTSLETNGSFPTEKYSSIMPYLNTVLLDVKATGSRLYYDLTGITESAVMRNLDNFRDNHIPVIIRCPIIPGVNDSEEHFRHIARLSGLDGVLGFELMPYHDLGLVKARRTGAEMKAFRRPSPLETESMEQLICSFNGKKWDGITGGRS